MTNNLSPDRESGPATDEDQTSMEIPGGQVMVTDSDNTTADINNTETPHTVEIHADDLCLSAGLAEESPDTASDPLKATGGTDIPKDNAVLLEHIHAVLESFHSRAEHYENVNRQLHSRVEDLQNDQVRVLLKPVFERLATLQAQAVGAAADARCRDSSSAGDFEFFAISIDELLALYDVEPVGAAPGITFDSKLHHGARIVPTMDLELDGRIQRVQRQGYRYAGADRVMLPARVSVYRYTAPAPAPETALDSDPSTS